MTFFHGTSEDNWKLIQEEGMLFGRRYILNDDGSICREVDRCTYLATDIEEARHYGDIILQVEYDPHEHPKKNNYIDDCWQVRVYEPIPIENIRLIKYHGKNQTTMDLD